LGYEFLDVDITGVDNNAPGFIQDQEGRSISSALILSLSQDTRNSAVLHTKGFKRSLYLKVAGLGGDEYYYKVVADAGWYFSTNRFINDSVFHMRGRMGFMNPIPFAGSRARPIYERFYVGGGDTVRGFATDEAGPEEDGSAIGGTKELIFNFEYLFPIVSSLKGVVFYDTGAAFDNGDQFNLSDMRHAVGFGIRLVTPFGPLKIDMGFKLDKKQDEDLSKVSFSVGTMF
jgi:outer membrane protein insertion porin family